MSPSLGATVSASAPAGLLKQAAGLTGATVVSQVLGAVTLLVQVRALSEEEIGVHQAFQSLAAVIASVCLLSYPSVLPHLNDEDASNLSAALLPVLVGMALVALPAAQFSQVAFAPLLVVQIIGSGLIAAADMLNLRFGRTERIAASRVTLSVLLLALNAALFYAGESSLERVVWGQAVLSTLVGLGFVVPALRRANIQRATWSGAIRMLDTKRSCPMYLAPAELLGSLTFNLPTLLIQHWFGAVLAGQYGVVCRLAMPVAVVSTTLGQSYHASLAASVRTSDPAAYARFLMLRRYLGALSLSLGAVALVVGPAVLSRLVSSDSPDLGAVARILTPLYVTMLWASPLAGASLQVFEAQRFMLGLQVVSMGGTVAAFGLGALSGSFWLGLAAYSGLVSVRYLLMLAAATRLSQQRLMEKH